MAPSGIITLITDFGTLDPYVGIIKGVILGLNKEAKIVDITHEVPPGDVFEAAIILKDASSHFPRGTVHVVVVDPGVGTSRRPLALVTDGFFFVAPDNGLLWPLALETRLATFIHLNKAEFFRHPISNTFHGRDVFAPVAAHLSLGIDPFEMGHPITDPVKLKLPFPKQEANVLKGQIIRIDRFGNLITNIDESSLSKFLTGEDCSISVGPFRIHGISSAYGNVRIGEELAIIGSSGLLEISINRGRACDRIGTREKIIGLPVTIERDIEKVS